MGVVVEVPYTVSLFKLKFGKFEITAVLCVFVEGDGGGGRDLPYFDGAFSTSGEEEITSCCRTHYLACVTSERDIWFNVSICSVPILF